MDLDVGVLLVLGLLVCLGALVQASVGFGIGVVAAPFVTILDPALMPESLLVVGASLPVLMLWENWRHVDRRGLLWALFGRLPGMAVGAYFVTVASSSQLGVAVAIAVFLAVALSANSINISKTPRTLFAAGALSGVTGTAAAIGGPPLALLYTGEPGSRIRATLAAYFLVGGLGSLLALHLAGEMETSSVMAGVLVVPFLALGHALAKPIQRRLDKKLMRPAILIVAALSALVLLLRSLS